MILLYNLTSVYKGLSFIFSILLVSFPFAVSVYSLPTAFAQQRSQIIFSLAKGIHVNSVIYTVKAHS